MHQRGRVDTEGSGNGYAADGMFNRANGEIYRYYCGFTALPQDTPSRGDEQRETPYGRQAPCCTAAQ